MAADPIVYCLEQLTDYDQFERLCHDLMALDGYRGIEPLGGSKDKGRDAIHIDRTNAGRTTIFAYSVREDWRVKLGEDCDKVIKHAHKCHQLIFLSTALLTAGERDKATKEIETKYGWPLDIYGIERLRNMLSTTHREVVAHHPSIFCPPFFPHAGGLSLSLALDHVLVDHVDSDTAIAHWIARRLTLSGYHVWCRGLAPLAGSSVIETVRGLLNSRAFRYLCILSPDALTDPNFTARRNIAQAIGLQRGNEIVLPVVAKSIDRNSLDQGIRRLDFARCEDNWAEGLKRITEALVAAGCPRKAEGAREIAISSYFPSEIVLNEPETLASNLFRVVRFPRVISRFQSAVAVDEDSPDLRQWGCRRVDSKHFLSFHLPRPAIVKKLKLVSKGGADCESISTIDGIRVDDLIKELIKKSVYAECLRRGLLYCDDRKLFYFPFGLLKNDRLTFKKLDDHKTFFSVTGERTHGKGDRARKYLYHLSPIFVPKEAADGGYEIIVRIRLRLTDAEGVLLAGRLSNTRRKKVCKSWWNEEWLVRTMGVVQFLAEGRDEIVLGNNDEDSIVINAFPRTWSIPVRLNEAALTDAVAIRIEEEAHLKDDERDEDE